MNESAARELTGVTTLLIVEDDVPLRAAVCDGLTIDGYRVHVAENTRQALHQLANKPVDLVLLDLNLPEQSGFSLLKQIRGARDFGLQIDSEVPVIVLSGRVTEADRVRGFQLGCDDYLVKPFAFGELRGRIEAVLRRHRSDSLHAVVNLGELKIDQHSRIASMAGSELHLTSKEFALLAHLASDPTRVFTKAELLRNVWGYRVAGSTRTLDSHACRLRKKLSAGTRRYVINLWGTGYRLTDIEPVDEPAGANFGAEPQE